MPRPPPRADQAETPQYRVRAYGPTVRAYGPTVRAYGPTWWCIPLSKWVITPVISGLTPLIPFITRVVTHLLSGMSHQVGPVAHGPTHAPTSLRAYGPTVRAHGPTGPGPGSRAHPRPRAYGPTGPRYEPTGLRAQVLPWGYGPTGPRYGPTGLRAQGPGATQGSMAVVARNTFPIQKCQKPTVADSFWKLRCRNSARRCGAKHISKSKCTKHTSFGPLLEVQQSRKCTPARSTFPSQNGKNTTCSDHFWKFSSRKVKMVKTPHVRTTF